MMTTPDVDTVGGLPCTISSFRIKHYQRAIVLRFAAGETAWELTLPDEDVRFTAVRVAMRELGSQRGAEASVLIPWTEYITTRDWLRCVPDGWLSAGDIQPAPAVLCAAFAPMTSALYSLL